MSINAYMLTESEQKVIKKLIDLIEWKAKQDWLIPLEDWEFQTERSFVYNKRMDAIKIIMEFVL